MTKTVTIGIDLGGTNCRGALVSQDGQLSSWRSIATDSTGDLTVFLKRLTDFCRQLKTVATEMRASVVGIGCGVAGVVDPSGLVRSAPNLKQLNGFDLQGHLCRELRLPALVINDANAIAWGEALYGGGQSFDSFLAITLGTGVGGGLILHRRLWQGVNGGAGEIGHLAVEVEGRHCGCGSHGCLEQYASGLGILQSFQELGGDNNQLVNDSFAVADLARHGNSHAQKAFDLAGRYLGQAIAGVANLLNLEGVLFAGGLSACLDLLQPSLERELVQRAFAVNRRQLHLVNSCLADRAGILGAANLLFDRLEPR